MMINKGNQWLERVIKGYQGYKKLAVWRNALKIRAFIYKLTRKFPKYEFKRTAQINDSASSIKQNIQEGYMRRSLTEYIHFLTISQGSLSELLGDLEDCYVEGLFSEAEFNYGEKLTGRTNYLFMRLIQYLEKKENKK